MKVNSIFVFILTLVIWFILGMLTPSQIRHHKFRPVKFFYSDGRFRESFYQTIKPDEKQKAPIEPILDKYGKNKQGTADHLQII